MLRPEQLHISLGEPATEGCQGVVTERDFGGNTCTLTVALQSGTGRSLLVRSTGLQAPPTGSVVHLTTVGRAHVLTALSPS